MIKNKAKILRNCEKCLIWSLYHVLRWAFYLSPLYFTVLYGVHHAMWLSISYAILSFVLVYLYNEKESTQKQSEQQPLTWRLLIPADVYLASYQILWVGVTFFIYLWLVKGII